MSLLGEALRAYNRAYSRDRYARRMAEIHAALGGKCVVCGSTENLDTHHLDPSTKSFDLSTRHSLPWAVVCEEIKKCELRCGDHHKDVHAPKHGTPSCYKNRKCRCEPCRLAWNEACKKWKKDSRARNRPALRTSDP